MSINYEDIALSAFGASIVVASNITGRIPVITARVDKVSDPVAFWCVVLMITAMSIVLFFSAVHVI